MSFLDKLTKAVTDTVDRGKKEVDEFMKIQKVKGEISEAERRIQEATTRIGDLKREIGDRAVALLRSGALTQPELEGMAEPIAGFEQHIAEQQAVIADKKLEIERIKAEGDAAAAAPSAGAPPLPANAAPASPEPPVAPPPPPPVPAAAVPPPPATGVRTCPSCGKPVEATAAFCTECGAKV